MNKTMLKQKHRELEESEKWTAKEEQEFTKKDRSFIRNVQILNNFDKKKAVKFFRGYKKGSKDQLKELARNYRKKIKALYPKHKVFSDGRIKDRKQAHQKLPTKRESDVWKESRKITNKYLKTPSKYKDSNYDKIKKASKKYVDASPYELRYGVNSKKSQDYREKNGLPRNYTGRVIK